VRNVRPSACSAFSRLNKNSMCRRCIRKTIVIGANPRRSEEGMGKSFVVSAAIWKTVRHARKLRSVNAPISRLSLLWC